MLHTLVYASDQGVEFKGGFTDAARQDLLDAGLITSGDRFVHRLNLASAPTQAAHIVLVVADRMAEHAPEIV